MMIKFSTVAWEDYLHWQKTDKAILKRINQLIREIQREPFTGIGKPEPFKHQLFDYGFDFMPFSSRPIFSMYFY